MTLKELYEKVVNLSRQERINLARNAGGAVLEYLENMGKNEEERMNFIFFMTALFAGADGVVDEDETKLFNEITGASYTQSQLHELLKPCLNPEFVASMDRAIDTWDEEAKSNVCFYGLAFLSADGTISAKEQQIFERILA